MEKSKFSIEKTGKFLREISVVVIGVAITLSVSYWITNRTEKKDMALYLNAIKLEMEENIKYLDWEADYLEDWENYAIFLQSHDKKSLNPDSIRYSGGGLGAVHNMIFQTSAFEMFKTSGAMRLINDKELLQSIWAAYLHLEFCKLRVNEYFELKREACVKENQLELDGTPSQIPFYDFFVINTNFGALEECKDVSNELKATIEKLEKSKLIKQ